MSGVNTCTPKLWSPSELKDMVQRDRNENKHSAFKALQHEC